MSSEANIKKSFQELYSFLITNQDKKVKDIMPAIQSLIETKRAGSAPGSTYILDGDKVVAIRCWYFKRWMPLVGPKAVEFGSKKNTATGLNTMCKEGSNLWSKAQRDKRAAHEQMLQDIISGKLSTEKIQETKDEIEARCAIIQPTDKGFETKEEVEKYLAQAKKANK